MANVIMSVKSKKMVLPILNGANLFPGTLLKPGATQATNAGVLITAGAGASNIYPIGVLSSLFNFANSGDAKVDGTVDWFAEGGTLASGATTFPSSSVELAAPVNILSFDYDQTSTMAVASFTGQTITVTSLETDLDTGYVYATGGTGVGQLMFIASQGSGTAVLANAPSVAPDSTTTLIKILPLFHNLMFLSGGNSTQGTMAGTQAAAGSQRAVVLENYMIQNGLALPLNPLANGNMTGLNSLTQLVFRAHVALQDSIFYPIA